MNAKEKSILDTGTFVQKPWDFFFFFFFFASFEDLNKNQGNSLVVQWLGLHNLTAKGLGLIPGWRTKVLKATWHGQKKRNPVWLRR